MMFFFEKLGLKTIDIDNIVKKLTEIRKSIYKVFDQKNLIKKRIAWHRDQVSKTVKYFQSLKKLKLINGNQSVPKVTKDILGEIKRYSNQKN